MSTFVAGTNHAPREAKAGADLEVRFYDSHFSHPGFGWRVQAKRISFQRSGCVYSDIDRHVGGKAGNSRQIDLLIDHANGSGLAPWYWLYNTSLQDCACPDTYLQCGLRGGCAHCGHMHHSFVESGILAVPASEMKSAIAGSKLVTTSTAMTRSWHLRCLFTTNLARAHIPSNTTSLAQLIGHLHRFGTASDASHEFTALPVGGSHVLQADLEQSEQRLNPVELDDEALDE